MCGIYGELVLSGGGQPSADLVRSMGEAIVHRGPDDDGMYSKGPIAMGLRRLSIIDVTGGHQPISNEDGTVVVVCNGEIYNFRELREQLRASGHQFRTGSDAEVLVHLYEEHGLEFVDHLRGMYGFGLWDSRRQRLVLGRDRLGIKPVYYATIGRSVVFASEAKAIVGRSDYSPSLDGEALGQFLMLGYVPSPYSMFAGVRQIKPGTMLVLEGGACTEHRFWRFETHAEQGRDDQSWISEIRTALRESIHGQMISDVPIGAFLSGGIDSSTIVAAMSEFSTSPVKTYAIGYTGSTGAAVYNELKYARQIADHFGTEHHEIEVQPHVIEMLPRLVWHLDDPISDSALITSSLVSEYASRDVKVILSGVGGDELFGGYDRYKLPHLVSLVRILPRSLRRGVLNPLLGRVPVARHSRILNLLRAARKIAAVADKDKESRYHQIMEMFSRTEVGELLPGNGPVDQSALEVALSHYVADCDINQMMAVDLATQLPDDLLMLTDKMSMSHSLECRVPLLDERLVDLAGRLPADLRVRGGENRYILKKALAGILPETTLHRAKRGFGAPFGAWFANELLGVVQELIGRDAVRRRGLMNPAAVQRLIDDHQAKRADYTDHLVALTTLEIWCRLHLDGQTPEAISENLQFLVAA